MVCVRDQSRCKWCFVVICSVFIASGSFLNGYDIGSSNGIKEMDGFRESFNLTRATDEDNTTMTCSADDSEETSALLGLVVSVFSLGSLVGGLLGGPISDLGGRRMALVVAALFCASGVILQTSSIFMWMLLFGKLWTGLGNGIFSQVMALYIAEISPKHIRGKLVTLVSTSATLGVLVGGLTNLAVKDIVFGWRVTLGLQLLVACSMLVGSPFLPESPRWLVKRNKSQKALKILRRIYNDEDVASDRLKEISTSFHKAQLLLGFFILFFPRVSGVQLALYFSVAIFCQVGISGFVGGVITGVFLFSAQISVLFVTDKFGRKIFFLSGYFSMAVCLVITSILILAFGLEEDTFTTEKTIVGYFVVLFLALFVGIGVVFTVSQAWVIVSEIFPLEVKGVAVAIATAGFWTGNIIAGEVSPFLLASPLGTAGTLLLHAGLCALVFVFVLLLIPETKKLSLEQVDQLFSLPLLKRTNPLFYLTCGRISSTNLKSVDISQTDLEPLDTPLDELNSNVCNSLNVIMADGADHDSLEATPL